MNKKSETVKEQKETMTMDKPVESFPGDTPMSQMSDDKAQLPATQTAAPPAPNPQPMKKNVFEEYGETDARYIVGQLLKFNKGDWVYGQNGAEFEIGHKLIANMEQLLLGWVRWEDQKPVEQRMGLLVDGFAPAKRDELGFGYEPGDTDETCNKDGWEVDERSKLPRDPWQFTYYLVMKDLEIKDEFEGVFTFSTSSSGGDTAIKDLCKIYGRKIRTGDVDSNGNPIDYQDYYPVVALRVGSYNHSVYGKTKVPVLQVVGWSPKNRFGALPAPVDATEQLAQAKGEDVPF